MTDVRQNDGKVARLNGFVQKEFGLSEPLAWNRACFQGFPQTESERDDQGLLAWYVMDAASVLPPEVLGVKSGMNVLDMCAAPGGKTLLLIEKLAEDGQLIANDVSSARRRRLSKVIENYVPEQVRQRIQVTGHDASRWGLYHKNEYDRILLDAPCSGDKKNSSISKKLAYKQYALLCSALMAVKPGGRIVYSTCTLSPLENDGVIEKLMKKKSDFSIGESDLPIGERTEYGYLIDPEKTGYGPIYLSIIDKNLC